MCGDIDFTEGFKFIGIIDRAELEQVYKQAAKKAGIEINFFETDPPAPNNSKLQAWIEIKGVEAFWEALKTLK